MHKMDLKDVVKDLLSDETESKYFCNITLRCPKLLVHCYNAVEKEARDLLAEYFHLDANELTAKETPGLKLEEFKLTIDCKDVIAFPKVKTDITNSLKICNSSHLFIEQNESFTNFLQINGWNITQLEFSRGTLTFESVNKILQKLRKLKEIEFSGVEYGASKTVLTTKYHNLAESEIWSAKSSNLLQAFLECQTKLKLKIFDAKETLEEILQKYPSLVELEVFVKNNYPVSDQHEANATIHQLKVLKITLSTKDIKIQGKLISSILKLNNLQQFNFNSSFNNFSQSFYKQLTAHICQLERLSSLSIYDEKLFEKVVAFVANGRVTWITRLEEFGCQLKHFRSLPSSFLAHFTNLRKLNIYCNEAEETQVQDLISFMNKSQLTSIKLWSLPTASFQLFQHLQVDSLQVLETHIHNMYEVQVPALDILQEFLPRHPNITHFEIRFFIDYDEPKSLELIPMILATLTKLERLVVGRCPKLTRNFIKQIAALKTLMWEINEYRSETFHKTNY